MLFLIIMAIIQGIAEFLPISSSLHLKLAAYVLDGSAYSNAEWFSSFCILLNIGSLLAICCYYWKDVICLLCGLKDCIIQNKTKNREFFLNISIASIPTMIVFGLAELKFGGQNFSITASVMALVLFSFVILATDKYSKIENKQMPSLRNWLVVGIMQLLSLLPGVSRLGSNLVAFRLLKFNRTQSFRFSMLFALPPITGACVIKLYKIYNANIFPDFLTLNYILLAISISFLCGIITLRLVNLFISRFTFSAFAIYRIIFALLLLFII